jgi:hypothetical protein
MQKGPVFYSVIFLHVPGYIECILFMHQPKEVENFPLNVFDRFKGIDRSFRGGIKISLIRSLFINWRLGNFFSSHFKGIPSQDQQKTNRRRLIISKVTLTGQSDFMRIFVLRKVTLRDNINSVQCMYAIGPKNPLV